MKRIFTLLIVTLLLPQVAGCSGTVEPRGPLVLAPASLHNALQDAAEVWTRKGNARPVLSFGGTPSLARQIGEGAPADIFIAADEQWMDYIAHKELIQPRTRASLASNGLVLVAPAEKTIALEIGVGFPLAHALGTGRLAMANPDTVPAGRYARQALETLNVWPSVSDRITRTENVRIALALVSRGEAPLGIVYSSDALVEPKVQVIGTFSQGSHAPIRYPAALLNESSHAGAEGFLAFLLTSEAQAIFNRHGFSVATALQSKERVDALAR